MSQWNDHEVAGVIGKFVQDNDIVFVSFQDKVLFIVILFELLAEDTFSFSCIRLADFTGVIAIFFSPWAVELFHV
jgi:hypothetical protein